MISKSRKSQQGATAAAALIAIIAALIVIYILVLPPTERERLLEGENITELEEEENELNLLSETSLKIYPPAEKEYGQELPSVNIFISQEAVELKRLDSVYTSKSLFSEKKAVVNFEIIDLENTKNLLLNFDIKKSKGRLIIKLNDYEIFNKEIETINIEPIKLQEYLKQGINTLEFSVSSPGAVFWKTNEFSLEHLLITADMIQREAQESKTSFVISQSERDNLKKLKLHFYPDCDLTTVGKLEIWINNFNLYSAVPDCGMPNRPLEFSPEKLVPGENQIIFKTEKGKYLIDNIKLTSELEKIEVPVYYFSIKEERYEEIENNELDAKLTMRFVDDTTYKKAKILVNGHALSLEQKDIDYEKIINDYIVKGNNALKIEPEKTLDIVELSIDLED